MSASSVSRFIYRAFISYSHHDKAWADWLHKALETWRVPSRLIGTQAAHGVIPRSLQPIFRDREELASATDLGEEITDALDRSECLIVICSPAAAASRWVNEEVLAFKRMGRGGRILCLIVDGEPDATGVGRETEECFCPALRFALDATGELSNKRAEPIAADVRPGHDSKPTAKLRLIAGVLGVGFDALIQREAHRRMRRMAVVTAAALAMMAITSVLAIYALNARRDAVTAQQAAERRQKQAEDLVGFMLGDLNEKLQQVGRLDIMQTVDDKAMAYFASLPAADATNTTLAMRVTALEKIGGVRMDQGNTPAALEAFRSALTLASELVRRAPGDPAREATYADSLKWIGQAYWYQGDLVRALENFEGADAALQKSLVVRPDDVGHLASLAYIQTNTGRVLEARGDLAEAKNKYESVLKIFQRLAARQPSENRWQSEVGFAWNNLGTIALQQGRLEEAVAAYRSDQHIKATLAAHAPDNHQAKEDLLVSNAILGRTLALCGDTQGALTYTTAAVNSATKLAAADADNANWQEYRALYGMQLASLLRQGGRLEDAATTISEAIRMLVALAVKDPTRADYTQELAQGRLEEAQLQLVRGNPQAAMRPTKAALVALQALQAKAPGDQSLVLSLAQARIVAGRGAALRHDSAAAQLHWTRARDALAPRARSSNDPRQLATYAEALLRLGDTVQAEPIVSQLSAMGYRTPDFVALVTSAKLAYPINSAFAKRIAGDGEDADAQP